MIKTISMRKIKKPEHVSIAHWILINDRLVEVGKLRMPEDPRRAGARRF